MGTHYRHGINYSGGGGGEEITLISWAEYQALNPPTPGVWYAIYDYKGGLAIVIDDSVIALDKTWSSSKISSLLALKADLSSLPIVTSAVSCLVGDTSCTITNANIYTTSEISPYFQNASETSPTNWHTTTTTGQVVITFDALEEATSIYVKIINYTVPNSNS